MTELIELDITEAEQEAYVRNYITQNMSSESLEQYVYVLNITDNLAEACKSAILNEFINISISHSIK